MLIDTEDFVVKRLAPEDILAPESTALLIIDMTNRFLDAAWLSSGDPERERWLRSEIGAVVPRIRVVLDACRRAGALVVHVVNAKWTLDAREAVPYQRGRDYGLFDTPEMSPIEELAPTSGEIVIRKVASSAFTGTGLDFLLHNVGIENVLLTGTWGSACVFYSLIQSREYGFSNVYVEDAVLFGAERDKHLFPALVGSYWGRLARAEDVYRALS